MVDGGGADGADKCIGREFAVEGVPGAGEHGGRVAAPVGEGDDTGVVEYDAGNAAALAGDADSGCGIEAEGEALQSLMARGSAHGGAGVRWSGLVLPDQPVEGGQFPGGSCRSQLVMG